PPPPPHNYTLSLHDALPISGPPYSSSGPMRSAPRALPQTGFYRIWSVPAAHAEHSRRAGWISPSPHEDCITSVRLNYCFRKRRRSEEHTSELQSLAYLVCRL